MTFANNILWECLIPLSQSFGGLLNLRRSLYNHSAHARTRRNSLRIMQNPRNRIIWRFGLDLKTLAKFLSYYPWPHFSVSLRYCKNARRHLNRINDHCDKTWILIIYTCCLNEIRLLCSRRPWHYYTAMTPFVHSQRDALISVIEAYIFDKTEHTLFLGKFMTCTTELPTILSLELPNNKILRPGSTFMTLLT